MNVKHHFDHCREQNFEVDSEENKISGSEKFDDVKEWIKCKATLEKRVESLKHDISTLKLELLEEKALWKKEIELMSSLMSSNSESDFRADAGAEVKTDVPTNFNVAPTESLMLSSTIKDFEEKLNRYQGALAQAHAEKRLNLRRQMAANTYRKRLSEVEKLCQEELNKVRETATYLEPLKQIALEWNKPRSHEVDSQKMILRSAADKTKYNSLSSLECGGDYLSSTTGRDLTVIQEDSNYPYEVPVKQIDASLVMDEDASNEIRGKIVFQIGSLPSEVPTICYSAKFE